MFRTLKQRLFFRRGMLRNLNQPKQPNLPRGVKVETRDEGMQYITPVVTAKK